MTGKQIFHYGLLVNPMTPKEMMYTWQNNMFPVYINEHGPFLVIRNALRRRTQQNSVHIYVIYTYIITYLRNHLLRNDLTTCSCYV